jgi:hypothetical protein
MGSLLVSRHPSKEPFLCLPPIPASEVDDRVILTNPLPPLSKEPFLCLPLIPASVSA